MGTEEAETGMKVMPLGQHLEELRRRIIVCIVAFAAVFLACWVVRDRLMALLVWPHVRVMRSFELDPALKFQSYMEPVLAQLKACAIAAVAMAAPVIIYEIWAFVAPGLFAHERRRAVWLGAACVACFFAGIAFGYFLFIPVALRYLLLLSGPTTEPVLMVGAYLTTFFLLTLALGVAFQTPVVIYFLLRWGVVTVDGLGRARKGVILGAFIVGAFLTPPDPMTQIMMAVTLIVLYDLGALVAAPSRVTLWAFARFTGAVVLVAAIFIAWYGFRPVAHVTALRGTVQVGERRVEAGRRVGVRRGAICRAPAESLAEFSLGTGQMSLHLAGEGQVLVQGAASVTLQKGEALAENPSEGATLTVHAGPATVTVQAARAELSVPGADVVVLTVFEGTVEAKVGGSTRRVSAGETLTLRRGGRPTDTSEAAARWLRRLKQTADEPGP